VWCKLHAQCTLAAVQVVVLHVSNMQGQSMCCRVTTLGYTFASRQLVAPVTVHTARCIYVQCTASRVTFTHSHSNYCVYLCIHTLRTLQVTVKSLAEQVCVYTVLGTHSGQLLQKRLQDSSGDASLPVGSAVSLWTYNGHEVCTAATATSIVCTLI
jgi:hypothetical protein